MDLMEEYSKPKPLDAVIRFESRPERDDEASRAAGHTITKDVHYVSVQPKGERATSTEYRASNLARRDPVLWEQIRDGYERWKAGHEDPPDGTPLKGWTGCTQAQMYDLFNMNIRTVEDLAGLTDAQCQKQTGFVTLRTKAQNYLKAAAGPGKAAEELTALQAESEDQKALIASLTEQVMEMKAQLDALSPRRGKAA
jgi:hypothetical protein